MVDTVETMLDSVRRAPNVVVTPFHPEELMRRHQGGPRAIADDQKLRIVRGWLQVQGRVNQEIYSQGHGISSATLRRWMRQLEQKGKL
jgi:transposase-like protein